MAEELRPQVTTKVIVREEGDEGEALVFDPETERVKVLNRSGLLLWNWCDGQHTRQDLVAGLAGEYPGIEESVLWADVDQFLQDLLRLGLVEGVAGDDQPG